eukprot:CAMPEP_0182580422 /NCGR_PEP_ID=MMETSP1324-20130603/47005_1 /TAXON_ID=236786 /ORGANISM="Florenciella sp., Strain RCC1587" /LENGTH=103 /DNA_ID=CAMNT_0024796647 /DNA_START=179 /DNA_END=486 /DNA_ORIENTATION=+
MLPTTHAASPSLAAVELEQLQVRRLREEELCDDPRARQVAQVDEAVGDVEPGGDLSLLQKLLALCRHTQLENAGGDRHRVLCHVREGGQRGLGAVPSCFEAVE